MTEWFPLHNRTHYSLLKGFSKPEELVKRCVDNGYKLCGIADFKSLAGTVAFSKKCESKGIRPVLGCSFDSYQMYALNAVGWNELIKVVSSIDVNGKESAVLRDELLANGNMVRVDKQDGAVQKTCYVDKSQAELHRILLASEMKTTLRKAKKLSAGGEDFWCKEFFLTDDFYVPEQDESATISDPEGMAILQEIESKLEDYSILSPPMLPTFPTPNGETEEEYLKEMCRDGWKEFINGNDFSKEKKQIYLDRFKKEFGVIEKANLFGYFLIVQDIMNYAKENDWMTGPGRGSAAGCLISYLIGITQIDPIQYDLIFERFFNAGRSSDGHVSLPDIDMDLPKRCRQRIVDYVKGQYGAARVCQMITLGRLQGRGAIKEVARVTEACHHAEVNEITKYIPDEADIADELQVMDEEDRSIIRWALEFGNKNLKDFCYIENGEFYGPHAELFKTAIEIEGTFKSQGKHAAGVVISQEPLKDVCPMTRDKEGNPIAALEMSALEDLGHVKFDFLSINYLDKIMCTERLIAER